MPRAVVTGAKGFIGQHLVTQLGLAGWRVDVVIRSGAESQPKTAVENQRVYKSLSEVQSQLHGVDCVFHLAGLAHDSAGNADAGSMNEVNVQSTLQMYDACASAGVSNFVWLSSLKVLGDACTEPLKPDHPYAPVGLYAESKVRAEEALLARSQARCKLVIVRPPLVYGVGVGANFLSLIHLAGSNWPLPLANATEPRAWVSVNNLVSLLMRLSGADVPSDRIWHVCDEDQISVARMIRLMRSTQRRGPGLWSVPKELAMFIGKMVGREDQLARLFNRLDVDMQQTVDALSWRPEFAQAMEVSKVVEWSQK